MPAPPEESRFGEKEFFLIQIQYFQKKIGKLNQNKKLQMKWKFTYKNEQYFMEKHKTNPKTTKYLKKIPAKILYAQNETCAFSDK